MQFPVPKRFSLFGIDSFGYADEVIFPLTCLAIRLIRRLILRARPKVWSVPIFVFPSHSLSRYFFLPAMPYQPSMHSHLRLPPALCPDVRQTSCPLFGGNQHRSGSRQITLDAAVLGASIEGRVEDIFVETELSGVSFAAPVLSGDSYYMAVSGLERVSDATPLTLTVVTDTGFAEFGAEILPISSATPQPSQAGLSLPVMLVISFLGGLILNFMPCVLPVLLLKLNSIISVQTERAGFIRTRLLTGAAGILASFSCLVPDLPCCQFQAVSSAGAYSSRILSF